MRTCQDIIEYIDDAYEHMKQHPTLYATSGTELELQLITLENVRDYAAGIEKRTSSRYLEFLNERGIGPMLYSKQLEAECENGSDDQRCLDESLAAVCDLWDEYLRWRGDSSDGKVGRTD